MHRVVSGDRVLTVVYIIVKEMTRKIIDGYGLSVLYSFCILFFSFLYIYILRNLTFNWSINVNQTCI